MAIEEAIPLATPRKVGEWVALVGGKDLALRAERLARIESSSFDADSQSGPDQVFRSKRATDGSYADASRTGETGNTGRSGISNARSFTSSTEKGELLPSPPVETPPTVQPSGRSWKWPVVAGTALLVAVAATSAMWFSPRTRTKAVGKDGPGQGLQLATRASTVTESRPSLQPNATNPSAMAPTHTAVTAPATEETARAASMPTVPTSNSVSKTPFPATNHRALPKTAIAKLLSAGKPRKKKDCNPPYYIDPSGIRRIKDECF